MDRPLDKRRKISWKIAGKLMPDRPDADGEIFWIVEIHVAGNFKSYRNPVVSFMAGTKLGDILDPADKNPPVLPIYRYVVEVNFPNVGPVKRNITMQVMRLFDEEGRLCQFEMTGRQPYRLTPWLEEEVGWDIQEGIWQTLITGKVKRDVANMEEIWRNITPYLLEMSRMPDMRKMEELFNQAPPEHEELHTDVGAYDEGLSALIAKEVKLLGEVTELKSGRPITLNRGRAYPLMRMPAPTVLSKERPVEHSELHSDNGPYDE